MLKECPQEIHYPQTFTAGIPLAVAKQLIATRLAVLNLRVDAVAVATRGWCAVTRFDAVFAGIQAVRPQRARRPREHRQARSTPRR